MGLTIRWCEDLRSYKKLIPALRDFPEDIIVTADDDIYYQTDWLESLYNAYLKNPANIYTRRASLLKVHKNCIDTYAHYANKCRIPLFGNQLMGGAGTLYPPHTLHNDIFNIEQIQTLIPTYDDIYFWAMAVLGETKISLVKNKDLNINEEKNSFNDGLCKINNSKSGISPEEAFLRIFKKYPEILEKLRSENE